MNLCITKQIMLGRIKSPWETVVFSWHATCGIYWVCFLFEVIAFVWLHQSHSVYHPYHLSQFQCLNNSSVMSHIHCSHSHMFTTDIPNFFLILHIISCTTLSKSSDHRFWRDLLPWSRSTGRMGLHWAVHCPCGIRTQTPTRSHSEYSCCKWSLKGISVECRLWSCPSKYDHKVSIHCMNQTSVTQC
jgi:hypothetical protein